MILYSMDTVSLPAQRVCLIVGDDLALYVQAYDGDDSWPVISSMGSENGICLHTYWARYRINRDALRHIVRQAALAFDTHIGE